MTQRAADNQHRSWRIGSLFLLGATTVLCLSVVLLNGGPLFYYDTGSYIRQGDVVLNMILPADQAGAADGTMRGIDDDSTADGSRSLFYGMIIAALFRAGALSVVALLQFAAVMLAAFLVAGAAKRCLDAPMKTLTLVAVPLLAAASTALPFYIAYMMPDIFAAILLIVIAGLAVFGRTMSVRDLLLMLGLALLAVLVHPSHMAIAGLMIPFVILVALLRKTPGRWRATALLVLVVLVAITERKAFEFAAETVVEKTVTYTPHITARLIVDGPGMTYLNETCPDQDEPTCALHEALSWSDDPYRLTASHIIFEQSPKLGSFRLMTPENQQRVAAGQRDFFISVFLSQPFSTSWAFGENAYDQLLRNSIGMTVPTESMLDSARRLARLGDNQRDLFKGGRLAADRGWIEPVNTVHEAVYMLSFGVILICLLWPGRVPADIKLFALLILIGLFMNALVCGGVSQPADRYGARVMWLLPFTAAFLILFLPRRKTRPDSRVHS